MGWDGYYLGVLMMMIAVPLCRSLGLSTYPTRSYPTYCIY